MGTLETLIVTTALAGVVGTGLGGLIGALLQRNSIRTVSLLLSFAGGVMLSVVCFDLVVEAVETQAGLFAVVASISLGVAATFWLNPKAPPFFVLKTGEELYFFSGSEAETIYNQIKSTQ